MNKRNLFLDGSASQNEYDGFDEVTYYTNVFPSAIPLVYNHSSNHPLESRLNELYGDSFFLIYRPLGSFSTCDDKNSERPFYLILVYNAHTFEKYVDFFSTETTGRWPNRSRPLRKDKIKCFGSVKLLMLNEDEKKFYSQYRNAISLAFKDGKNPVSKDRRLVSYLYIDNRLVETPDFLMWDEDIEKEFKYGHQWYDEDEKS